MTKTDPEEDRRDEVRSRTISCIKCRAAGCGELKVLFSSGWQAKTPVEGEEVYFCPLCSGSVVPG
jgi:hypothetical protein